MKKNRSRKHTTTTLAHIFNGFGWLEIKWEKNNNNNMKKVTFIETESKTKWRQDRIKRTEIKREEKETAKHYKITWRLVRQLCLNKVFCVMLRALYMSPLCVCISDEFFYIHSKCCFRLNRFPSWEFKSQYKYSQS